MSNNTAGLLEQASSLKSPSKSAALVFTASINPTYTYGKVTEDSGASDASSGDFIHPAQRILRVCTSAPVCFCFSAGSHNFPRIQSCAHHLCSLHYLKISTLHLIAPSALYIPLGL